MRTLFPLSLWDEGGRGVRGCISFNLKMLYIIQADGSVLISNRQNNQEEADPLLQRFLDFIEQDMAKNPQEIKEMTISQIDRISSLVGNVSID